MPAPNPTAYTRDFGFADYQALNPTLPAPGAQIDGQLDRLSATTASTIAALADIRRSDGALQNSIVTPTALSSTTLALMGAWNPRGVWASATAYAVRDLIAGPDGITYVCAVAHTSGIFATDLAASRWTSILGSSNTLNGTATVTATGGSAARSLSARFAESLSVLDFGADPTGVADSTAAFNSALALGTKIRVPAGTYRVTASLVFTSNAMLEGEGWLKSRITATGNFDIVSITGGVSGTGLRDLAIWPTAANSMSGGHAVSVNDAANFTMENVVLANVFRAGYFEKVNQAHVRHVWVNGIAGDYCWKAYGTTARRSDIVVFDHVYMGNLSRTWNALVVDGFINTTTLDHFYAVQCNRGVYFQNTTGNSANDPLFLIGQDIEIDFSNNEGIRLDAGRVFWFQNIYVQGSLAEVGFFAGAGATVGVVSNAYIYGHRKEAVVIAGQDWRWTNGHIGIASYTADTLGFFQYDTIRVASTAQGVTLSGMTVGGTPTFGASARAGVSIEAGAQRVSVIGCDLTRNAIPLIDNATPGLAGTTIAACPGMTGDISRGIMVSSLSGHGALAGTITVVGGVITAFGAMAAQGSGYTGGASVAVFAPTGSGFVGTCTVVGGRVTAINITSGGSGYTGTVVARVTPGVSNATVRAWRLDGSSGILSLEASGASSVLLRNDNGTAFVATSPNANAVNYVQASSSITGQGPSLFAAGSDTNIPLGITAKGNANVSFSTGNGFVMTLGAVASAVNYLSITSAATGASAILTGFGEANAGITVDAAGTGNILIGSAVTKKIGLYGVTPVVQPAGAAQAALTDSTGGTASTTLAAITAGAAYAQADMVAVKNALASLANQTNAIRAALVALGAIKGSA